MCGRYSAFTSTLEFAHYFGLISWREVKKNFRDTPASEQPGYNVAPGQKVRVCRRVRIEGTFGDTERHEIVELTWGLLPQRASASTTPCINARGDRPP
jgi:putative SOS response-associated peptidase YedK